jgi:hypothetical protein
MLKAKGLLGGEGDPGSSQYCSHPTIDPTADTNPPTNVKHIDVQMSKENFSQQLTYKGKGKGKGKNRNTIHNLGEQLNKS